MAKCLGEGRMHDLWRKAVLILCNHRCMFKGCHVRGDENLACHHIVRKSRKITRWLPENGCSLCNNHHTGKEGVHLIPKNKRDLESNWEHIDLLDELSLLTYKDYLQAQGLTNETYYTMLADRMKKIIKESE